MEDSGSPGPDVLCSTGEEGFLLTLPYMYSRLEYHFPAATCKSKSVLILGLSYISITFTYYYKSER